MEFEPGKLTVDQLTRFYFGNDSVSLSQSCWSNVQQSRDVVMELIDRGETVYGLNTGFGLLANKKISTEDLAKLQVNLVRSHCAGTGDWMDGRVVRLIMLLKATSLARGYSGVRREVIEILTQCLNANLLPCVPEKGSVGASGDLAPLAHMLSLIHI